jgi:hypothetical protein
MMYKITAFHNELVDYITLSIRSNSYIKIIYDSCQNDLDPSVSIVTPQVSNTSSVHSLHKQRRGLRVPVQSYPRPR